MPELRLASGKTLKAAVVRSYSSNTVLVRHRDGASVVRYDDFPGDFQAALSKHRPGGAPDLQATTPPLAAVEYDFPLPPEIEPQPGDEQTLAGRVFVTTSDAGDVKLGGVKVSIYSKADYRRQAAWYFAHPWAASRAHGRNAEVLAKAGNGAGSLREFEAATETAALGWLLVAPAQFSTTTDADGRFTLKHRVAPPYFVVAHASRVVDGEVDYYRWAMLSTLIDQSENLLLFNDNME